MIHHISKTELAVLNGKLRQLNERSDRRYSLDDLDVEAVACEDGETLMLYFSTPEGDTIAHALSLPPGIGEGAGTRH